MGSINRNVLYEDNCKQQGDKGSKWQGVILPLFPRNEWSDSFVCLHELVAKNSTVLEVYTKTMDQLY